MFREETVNFTIKTENDTNGQPPISIVPRTQNKDDTPKIIGIVFGVIGGLLFISLVIFTVKRHIDKRPAGNVGTNFSEELSTEVTATAGNPMFSLSVPSNPPMIKPSSQLPNEEPKPPADTNEYQPPAPEEPKDPADTNEDQPPASEEPKPPADTNEDQPPASEEPKDPADTNEEQPPVSEEPKDPEDESSNREDNGIIGSVAPMRATYLWNSSANAVADPPPGGQVVEPSLSRVVDDVLKQHNS
eukprot:gene6818-9500_t